MEYKILHLTENLISIKNEKSLIFCNDYPSDLRSVEIFNYIIIDRNIYSVDIAKSNSIFDSLLSKVSNVDCNYKNKEAKLDIYFQSQNLWAQLYMDKICNMTTQIEFNKSIFDFTQLKD